ncbi:MAG: flavohemoglobin expression-modulating QEGLA motif protein [Bacteriovoracaceae bacterium]|nr:flavohemoglobin expression-modulating QEGLA motif protein [Bacteriovoracaceae bacterium]
MQSTENYRFERPLTMLKQSITQIISKINKEETFSCFLPDSSISITVEDYVPYICTAIHNGGNMRRELRDKCSLTKAERWQEEDPHTGDFISSLPIRLIAHDSRYEYDLNRPPSDCIYTKAWGKDVWTKTLTQKDKSTSIKKHDNYYRIIDALVAKLEGKFNGCLVIDLHSYNGKREGLENAPTFNLGSKNIRKKYRPQLDYWLKRLKTIELPFMELTVEENDVFQGNGYQLKYLTKKYKKTLVLATEIKKIYLDEESGDIYPEIITSLKEEFKKAITFQAKFFANEITNVTVKKRHGMLSPELEPVIKQIDSELYKMLHTFDVLNYVTPTNLDSEKRKFLKLKVKRSPVFKYLPLQIENSLLKRALYSLPTQEIKDVTLQNLYTQVIDSYADQVDLLYNRETIKFLYSSLKYYGEPSAQEIEISKFLLSAPHDEIPDEQRVGSDRIKTLAEEMIEKMKFKGKVVIARNIAANAIFNPDKNQLRIKPTANVTESYAQALAHHEIGIHMLTTENAKLQSLNILKLGFPLDTKTQEGLAILSEYLSGNLSISRLKELALRVMAVEHMIKNYDFVQTFEYLVNQFNVDQNHAFNITARVYRGGGFTKDYLYLSGFKDIFRLFNNKKEDVSSLLIGKTSIEFISVISELISRGQLVKPKHEPLSFKSKSKKSHSSLEYILRTFLD